MRNDPRYLFLYGILLILGGCVSLPKEEQTEHLMAPPSIQQEGNSAFFTSGDWPKEEWWKIFDLKQLDALIEEALGQNPTLKSVAERIEQAKQEAKIAKSRLFPLLFFNATESWTYLSKNGLYRALNPTIPLNANLVDLTLSFAYEFDFWGKNAHLFHAALGEERARQAETAQAELVTTTAVATAFFALKANLQKEQLYRRLLTVRREIVNLQELLYTEALSSKFSPLLSSEEVSEAEKLVFGIEEEVATTRHLLNLVIGKGPDAPLAVDAVLNDYSEKLILPPDLSLDLLSRRPDLMAQIWRVEALAHDVGAAKADFYPNVSLTALLGLESLFYRKLFKNESKTGSLQPALHLPIFTAGSIRANVRAKKAAFDEAVYAYNNLILTSAQEVADLIVLAQSVFSQKQSQQAILADAFERLRLTELNVKAGLSDAIAFYQRQEEVILKELENVNLLYSQYLASIKLIKALGGGYQSGYSIPLRSDR